MARRDCLALHVDLVSSRQLLRDMDTADRRRFSVCCEGVLRLLLSPLADENQAQLWFAGDGGFCIVEPKSEQEAEGIVFMLLDVAQAYPEYLNALAKRPILRSELPQKAVFRRGISFIDDVSSGPDLRLQTIGSLALAHAVKHERAWMPVDDPTRVTIWKRVHDLVALTHWPPTWMRYPRSVEIDGRRLDIVDMASPSLATKPVGVQRIEVGDDAISFEINYLPSSAEIMAGEQRCPVAALPFCPTPAVRRAGATDHHQGGQQGNQPAGRWASRGRTPEAISEMLTSFVDMLYAVVFVLILEDTFREVIASCASAEDRCRRSLLMLAIFYFFAWDWIHARLLTMTNPYSQYRRFVCDVLITCSAYGASWHALRDQPAFLIYVAVALFLGALWAGCVLWEYSGERGTARTPDERELVSIVGVQLSFTGVALAIYLFILLRMAGRLTWSAVALVSVCGFVLVFIYELSADRDLRQPPIVRGPEIPLPCRALWAKIRVLLLGH